LSHNRRKQVAALACLTAEFTTKFLETLGSHSTLLSLPIDLKEDNLMKRSNVLRGGPAQGFRLFTTVGFLAALLLSACTSVQTGPTAQPSPEASQLREWRESMAETPLPKEGCFQTSYPSREWQQVACVTAPPYPQPPKRGPRPFVVGSGNDLSPQTTGFISTGIGSFDSVSGVTSETGQINGTGPQVANAYSIQLNTNFFASTACSGAAVPASCLGWEQFVFANNGTSGSAFIQYWLISYNTPCPAGWFTFPFPTATDISCFRNSTNSSGVPNQPISNLINLSMSGTVSATGDRYTFGTGGGTLFSATGDNSVNAAAGWNVAEFAIVGNAGSGQANFNAGSTIVPRVRVIYGGTAAPTCVAQGFTGETNNLNFGTTAPAISGLGPALFLTETSTGNTTANCAGATTIGDTHLTTFGGLLYDFQASGDFLLAQADPDFLVQTRQVSGAPTWPNASVNSAVATRMGKDTVAVCLTPERPTLHVNDQVTDLDDGKSLSLPDGVDIWRLGNSYIITDQAGNSVRAKVNDRWIDVSVGLGTWPAQVRGLLADANGKVGSIEASDGTMLTAPFSFEELYQHYGESWRVAPDESLLSVCGEATERGNPEKPFGLEDLDPQTAERARGVCVEAGVKEGPLLDACTIDVAVIGDDAAAQVFVDATPPIVIGSVER
jgi:hypothetical protein